MIFLMAIVPMVSAGADDPDFTFKQVTQIDLKRPCFNNGTWCSPSAICNITIQSPNGDLIINNTRMTNQVSYHNVTLAKSQTVSLGTYKADMICGDGGLFGSDTFFYQITPSGDKDILGLTIILILLIYIITFFGFFGKHEWISVLGSLGMIILGLYTMVSGVDIYRNFMTDAFSIITIGLGAIIAITAAISIIEENIV